jgi:beta-N-acetylhexosaminidase
MSDLERLAARMIAVGFDGLTIPDPLDALLRRGIGGVVLFARNVQHPRQVAELNADLKRRAINPVMLCVDHEGGRVRRLRAGFSPIPSMRELGRTRSVDLARRIGTIIGQEVRAVGFDVDFAPVLDVDTNPKNPVIADRSLGADPALVARLGASLVDAIQSQGVAACGKHFPGHGDTWIDSHHDLPRLDHDRTRLDAVELVPFRACTHAASMMTSHIVFTKFDPTYPATLSPLVTKHLLRDEISYEGVIFTDDMEMKAIASFFGFDEAVIRAVEAGADVITICHSHQLQSRAIDVLIRAVEAKRLRREDLERSVSRIERLCAAYVRPAPDVIDLSVLDAPDHHAVIEQITRETQTQIDPTEAWRG